MNVCLINTKVTAIACWKTQLPAFATKRNVGLQMRRYDYHSTKIMNWSIPRFSKSAIRSATNKPHLTIRFERANKTSKSNSIVTNRRIELSFSTSDHKVFAGVSHTCSLSLAEPQMWAHPINVDMQMACAHAHCCKTQSWCWGPTDETKCEVQQCLAR